MAKKTRASHAGSTRTQTNSTVSTRTRTGGSFRPAKRKSSLPLYIAIFIIICGGIIAIKPGIIDSLMAKKTPKKKAPLTIAPLEIPDLAVDTVDDELEAKKAEAKRLAEEKTRRDEEAKELLRQKEIETLARQQAEELRKQQEATLARTTLTTMLESFAVEIPDMKVTTNAGDVFYGKVKTRSPLMIKTTLGDWKTMSESDIAARRPLSFESAKKAVSRHVKKELKKIDKADSLALFDLAHFCRVANYEAPLSDIIEDIATLDPKLGITMQNQYAGKLYRDSLYNMAKGQKGLAKKGFNEIKTKYPHSSYTSDADHFANAVSIDLDAMIAELQKKMGMTSKDTTKEEFTAEDTQIIENIDTSVSKASGSTKGDLYFKQAMRIYKKLDPGAANYKRKNAAALHLFVKSTKAYHRALNADPTNKTLERKLQKATMLRYGCMKMSTL